MDVDDTLPILMDEISRETLKVVRELGSTKDLDEKKKKAEIIHLLCRSMGGLLSGAADAMAEAMDYDDDMEFPED